MSEYLEEGYLPEHLINVPERSFVPAYKGKLGLLAVRLSKYKGFPEYEYDIGKVHRDIYLNGEDIGSFNLQYDYRERHISISYISLDAHRGEGIGLSLYESALELPLPSGENPRDNSFCLLSTGQSEDARATWGRLVKQGKAKQLAKTRFVMR